MVDPTLGVIATNFPPKIGGIESLLSGLAANAWPANTTVAAPPAPGDAEWDAGALFEVRRTELLGTLPPRWLRCRSVVSRMEAEVDVLLFAEWWPAARAAAAVRRQGAGTRHALRVLMAYGTEVVAAGGRAEASLCRAFRSVDLIIAISAFTASRVKERVPDCPRVEILNPGVDLAPEMADEGQVRRRLGLGPGPIVLTAARLVPRKGHTEFAACWPEVEARFPGAQWVVAGDGPCADALRAGAAPSIRMVGAVDRPTLMALFAMADVHLLPGLPSREVEGFGMVVSEAGAAGTPTVASDLGGVSEAVADGGVLVRGGDMAGLAEAVADLLEDGARRDALGRRARARAEQLGWDVIGSRFRNIICDSLGSMP